MIRVDGVVAGYGGRSVLDGLSVAVEPGEVVALVGRNGAGKTTAVRVLTGQIPAASGSACLLGMDAWCDRARIMARVGVVPEAVDVPPEMTVARLERLLRRLYPRWDAASVARRVERAGVDPRTRLSRLSRGQVRQVMLATALAPEPELVILDDVTQGLDPVARRTLIDEIIADLADRGTTVLLTSHDLDTVARVASRVAVLRAGRVVLDVATDELARRIRRVHATVPEDMSPDAVDRLLRRIPAVSFRRRGASLEILVDAADGDALARALGASGLVEAKVVPVPLEEVVVDLLEEEAS